MNAQEYRTLVNKLEKISEDPMDMVPDDITMNTGQPLPVTQTAPSPEIPTIEAPTFKQAYAQAVKQKLKKFKWCGTFAVKAASTSAPKPAVSDPKVDYVGQENPLGGTMKNPMSYTSNSNFGA